MHKPNGADCQEPPVGADHAPESDGVFSGISERLIRYLEEVRKLPVELAVEMGVSEYQGRVVFEYRRAGKLIWVQHRIEEICDGEQTKSFRCYAPDHKTTLKAAGISLSFWNEDELCAMDQADTLRVITEGQFDAVAVKAAGLACFVGSVPNGTTNKRGEGDIDVAQDGQFAYLWEGPDARGRYKARGGLSTAKKIVLCTDGDPAGLVLRDELADRLDRDRCWYVTYPEGCKDANEVLIKHGVEGVRKLIEEAQPLGRPLVAVSLDEFLARSLPERKWVVAGLLQERSVAMIHGWRGRGKSWFSMSLGLSIAGGAEFLKWKAAAPCGVLYVDGEMPAVAIQERFAKLTAATPRPKGFKLLSSDMHECGLPDLATVAGQDAIEHVLGDLDVLILDNVSTLFRTGVENEAESWLPVQQWLLQLRRRGKTVIIIHHSNKAKGQRGTSRREDILDLVLNLAEPKDYDPDEGARFDVRFEKARGLTGRPPARLRPSWAQARTASWRGRGRSWKTPSWPKSLS